ncbi:hypothetical protein FB45DRAFT_479187 [Roridomyces roridus]|uniref:DUF6534 domain-containing protein n=1 Tax=Roridomyces roridus TaxID=1738132 RepID=A0AAD7FNX4_9AGAR|nr:hypothetical protein FB45DRAFT_479187 [Roridomyces roridus]
MASDLYTMLYLQKSTALSVTMPFAAITTCTVVFSPQCICAYRGMSYRRAHYVTVRSAKRNKTLAVLLGASGISALVMGCSIGITSALYKDLAVPILPLFVLWMSFQLLTDIMNTGFLVAALRHSQIPSSSAMRRNTYTIVRGLICRTVWTGALTSMFTLVYLIVFLVVRDANFGTFFLLPMSGVYCSALLCTLNAQESFQTHNAHCVRGSGLPPSAVPGISVVAFRPSEYSMTASIDEEGPGRLGVDIPRGSLDITDARNRESIV